MPLVHGLTTFLDAFDCKTTLLKPPHCKIEIQRLSSIPLQWIERQVPWGFVSWTLNKNGTYRGRELAFFSGRQNLSKLINYEAGIWCSTVDPINYICLVCRFSEFCLTLLTPTPTPPCCSPKNLFWWCEVCQSAEFHVEPLWALGPENDSFMRYFNRKSDNLAKRT